MARTQQVIAADEPLPAVSARTVLPKARPHAAATPRSASRLPSLASPAPPAGRGRRPLPRARPHLPIKPVHERTGEGQTAKRRAKSSAKTGGRAAGAPARRFHARRAAAAAAAERARSVSWRHACERLKRPLLTGGASRQQTASQHQKEPLEFDPSATSSTSYRRGWRGGARVVGPASRAARRSPVQTARLGGQTAASAR